MDKWIDDYLEKRDELEKISDITVPLQEIKEDDLGVISGELVKEADFKLSKDSSQWTEQILENFYREHDWIEPENYYVKWRNEFEEGNALGVIVITKNDKAASIPLIVEHFRLKPLDIVYDPDEKKLYPLTKHNIEKIFFTSDMTDDVADPQQGSQKIMENVFAPNSGRYVHASADEKFLDKIAYKKEDIADFNAKIESDDVLFNANQNQNFIKTARKILNEHQLVKEAKKTPEVKSALVESEPSTGYQIHLKTDDGYKTKTASYYDTFQTLKESFGLTKEAIDEQILDVDKGKTVTFSKEKNASIVEEPEVRKVTSSGAYELDGVIAYVIPNIFRFDDGKLMGEGTLVIDKDREILGFTDSVAGRKADGQKSLMEVMRKKRTEKPVRNEVISFLWHDKKVGDYVGFQPVQILSYEQIDGLGEKYNILSPFGTKDSVIIARHLTRPDFSRDNDHNAVLLPEEACWLKQKSDRGFSTNPATVKESMLKDYTPFSAKYFRSTDTFDFLDKTATPEELTLELADLGVRPSKIESFIKEAAQNKEAQIYIKLDDQPVIEEEPEELPDLKQDTVKLASNIKDEQVIDQILSINFINDQNIKFFFKKLPKFKETVDSLTALLLASRLGKIGVDCQVIKEAMETLQELVENMEGYQFE